MTVQYKFSLLTWQIFRCIMYAMLFTIIALLVGMIGYHKFEHLSWIDSFANASMILSGMGQLNPLKTSGGKIFASCYALFSGLAFIASIAVILSPVFHRFLVKAHLESISLSKED